MKWFFALILFVLTSVSAQAQLGCQILPQSSLLQKFSDNAPAASITPKDVRDVICSIPSLSATATSCSNILLYGGVPDGVTDNSSAWVAALAASSSGMACIYFPPGNYSFASSVSYTVSGSISSVTIRGDGSDLSNLIFPSGNGITLNMNQTSSTQSFHVRDFSLIAGTSNTSTGLNINETGTFGTTGIAQSDVTNVTFRGFGSYQGTNCWMNDFFNTYHSNISFINDNFFGCGVPSTPIGSHLGNGIVLFGGSQFGIIYNITLCNFDALHQGIYYGNNIQGVNVNQSNFTPVDYPVIEPTSIVGIDQLTITGNQFGYNVTDIWIQTNMANMIVTGNLFGGGNSSYAIVAQSCIACTIVGNQFDGNSVSAPLSLQAIQIPHGWGIISGNQFYEWTQGAINLTGDSGYTVSANSCFGGTGNTPNIISTSLNAFITGSCTNGGTIAYYFVQGSFDNGSGITRVTLASTAQLVTGQALNVPITNTFHQFTVIPAPIQVIDSTHIDLTSITFAQYSLAVGAQLSTIP